MRKRVEQIEDQLTSRDLEIKQLREDLNDYKKKRANNEQLNQ